MNADLLEVIDETGRTTSVTGPCRTGGTCFYQPLIQANLRPSWRCGHKPKPYLLRRVSVSRLMLWVLWVNLAVSALANLLRLLAGG